MSPSRKTSSKTTSRKVSEAGRGAIISRLAKAEARLGQVNLAKMLGVSPRSVRRYKEGTRTPRADIAFILKRVEKASRGLRPTKSVNKKRARAEKIVREHPEVAYFEKRKNYEFAETEHIVLYDVINEDIPGLIGYLRDAGCDAAYFIAYGSERMYQSEIMVLDDFAESWEIVLKELLKKYNFVAEQVDLIGVIYHAPSDQTR